MLKHRLMVAALMLAALPAQVRAQDAANPPATIKQLHTLYSGKTWQWQDGAAYFRPDGGFIAYSGQGTKAAFVKGGWGAYKDGRLCFWGTWKSAEGGSRKATCFRHAVKGAAVYQQKPNGEWYVFKNANAAKADEANKLAAGDLASSPVAALQKASTGAARKALKGKAASTG